MPTLQTKPTVLALDGVALKHIGLSTLRSTANPDVTLQAAAPWYDEIIL